MGIRAPNHALALALIAELGELESAIPGLAGTSANLHDRPPPTRFDDLDGALGLDAGDGSIERIDGDHATMRAMMERSRRHTVPQIFIDDHHVGGFDDLARLEAYGKLDELLAPK